MNCHTLLLGTLVVVSFHTYVLADVIHVPGDYPTIQEAIDASSDGDEVVIADGTYTGLGNRDIDFGGRLITVRSENGPANCIIDCEGSEADPHRGFDFHHGETTAAVVQGLTIRNADVPQPGGAVACWGSSPTINNCVLTGNSASSGGGVYSYYGAPLIIDCSITGSLAGGGIKIYGGNPVVTNCTIAGNDGVGMFVFASDVVITNCTITDNTGAWQGGGMYIFGSDPVIANCSITGNSAGYAGGGMYYLYSNGTITDTTIINNTSNNGYGGGMYLKESSPTILDCTISGNFGPRGGGFHCQRNSSPKITNCIIIDNTALLNYNGESGGLGGGLYCILSSNPLITNCILGGNVAAFAGGAMYCTSSTPTISNSTFVENSALYGGAIACAGISLDSGPLIANSILWNDSAANGPEIALMDNSYGEPAALTIRYSDVENSQGGAYVEPGSELNWGPGNMDNDPLWVDPDSYDYHLSPGSPVIDAGDNTALPPEVGTDLEGHPRFIDDPTMPDTGFGECPIVDLGAYEFQEGASECCPQDLDGDGDIDAADLAQVLGDWGSYGPCPPYQQTDFDSDCDVDAADLALILGAWGICP